jgi:hypothetical protein
MNKFLIVMVVVFGYVCSGVSAAAATLSLKSDFSALRVGDVFVVDLIIDTEKQTLNAAEVEVIFPNDIFEYVNSNEGDSVVSLWVEEPSYQEPNLVTFSGITPGGFAGEETELMSFTFRAKGIGQGNIEINQASALLHDGLGTSVELTKQNLHLAVVEGDSEIVVRSVDDEIPEHFSPEVIQDKDVYNGAHSLIFATEDKGSGLDHFMVKEGWFGTYEKADSPYLLKTQSLDKKIVIKAVDRQGNERVEILYPQNWQPWSERRGVVLSILILCVLSLFLLWRLFGIWPRKRQ